MRMQRIRRNLRVMVEILRRDRPLPIGNQLNSHPLNGNDLLNAMHFSDLLIGHEHQRIVAVSFHAIFAVHRAKCVARLNVIEGDILLLNRLLYKLRFSTSI